jgi:hypothetical protein
VWAQTGVPAFASQSPGWLFVVAFAVFALLARRFRRGDEVMSLAVIDVVVALALAVVGPAGWLVGRSESPPARREAAPAEGGG